MHRLRLFGEPVLVDGQGPARATWRTHAGILAYLSLTPGGAANRSTLAGLFWPDVPEGVARASLRQAMFQLRRQVGEVVCAAGDSVELSGEQIEVDARRFEQLLDAGEWEAAVALYTAPFLEGFRSGSQPFDEWADRQRTRLAGRAASAFAELCEAAASEARWGDALGWAARWRAQDPFNEQAALRSIALRAQTGDRSGALAEYEAFRDLLRSELGIAPGHALEASVARIRRSSLVGTGQSAQAGRAAPADPTGSVAASPNVPFVGREAELARIRRCWVAAQTGDRQLLLVTGEAGIGKSRLVQEFAAWAELDGATILRGRAYEVERGVPYSMLTELLRSAMDAPGLAGVDEGSLGELGRIVPEYATRFPGVSTGPAGDLDAGRVRLLEALCVLVENLAYEAPLLLLLDDLVWADDATLAALHYLWRRLTAAPLLVLATARTLAGADEDPLQPLFGSILRTSPGSVHLLELEPLGVESIALLARESGVPAADESALAALGEETGGNPLFLQEALRARLEGSATSASPTVRAVIGERVGTLSTDARELVRAAAVLGRRFPFPFAAALASLPQPSAVGALEELLARRLLQQVGYEYDFVHDVVRETVYEGLSWERRRLLHGQAFERLTPAPADDVGLDRASRLALHASRAGLRTEARRWFLLSAELARGIFAGAQAERFLEQALDAADVDEERAEILERIADLRFAQSMFAVAALRYRAALALAPQGSDSRLRLRVRLLDSSLRAGLVLIDDAGDAVDSLLADAEAAGPAYRRDVLTVIASARLHARRFDEGATVAAQALEAARAAGDPRALVRALLLFAQSTTLNRKSGEALAALEEAATLAAENRLDLALCDAETDLGTELCRHDRWDDAIEVWSRVVARGERLGALGALAVARVNLADVLLRRGEWGLAEDHMHGAGELARRYGFPHADADVRVNRALMDWLRGHTHALAGSAQAAAAFAEANSLDAAEHTARALLVIGLIELDRADEAAEQLPRLELLESGCHPTWSDDRELVAIAKAYVARVQGRAGDARRTLQAALPDAGDSFGEALLRLELAELVYEDDPPTALELAGSAIACADLLGAVPLRERADRLIRRAAYRPTAAP